MKNKFYVFILLSAGLVLCRDAVTIAVSGVDQSEAQLTSSRR